MTPHAAKAKPRQPHTIIIARGDAIRHFNIRPWMAITAGALVCTLSAGYLLATSYLVFRDGLIQATTSREAHLREGYESRITDLRAQVDRLTSRQLLGQEKVERKVALLLQRQAELTARHVTLASFNDASLTSGLPAAPFADPAQDEAPEADDYTSSLPLAAYASSAPSPAKSVAWPLRGAEAAPAQAAPEPVMASLTASLGEVEAAQDAHLEEMTNTAYRHAQDIADALDGLGVSAPGKDKAQDAAGGPFIPLDGSSFESRLGELKEAVAKLDDLKSAARALPLNYPQSGHVMTSPFGVRDDPFRDTPAFHSGIDFRTTYGSAVHVTAAGVVRRAGWAGGYGRMVEVDHGHGLVTRYGHLSRIGVSVGQKIAAGAIVGRSGSSGRSTGPHVHYEMRKDGVPVNPRPFLSAGAALKPYL